MLVPGIARPEGYFLAWGRVTPGFFAVLLEQMDAVGLTGVNHFLRPDRGLDLTNVGLLQQEHTDPRLADAAEWEKRT